MDVDIAKVYPTGIVLMEEGHPQSGIAYAEHTDGSWSIQTSNEVLVIGQCGNDRWVPWPPPANDLGKATWRWDSLRDMDRAFTYTRFFLRAPPHERRAFNRMGIPGR